MTDIQTHHFTNASEFLNALRRSNSEWLDPKAFLSHWIFRGQREASWGLVPSAWRESVKDDDLYRQVDKTRLDESVQGIVDGNKRVVTDIESRAENVRRVVLQTRFEFLVVRAFVDVLDSLGLPIPGGELSNKISYELFDWLDDEGLRFHQAFALAQHHGMATRLLDWTHNPVFAAYFAAENVDPNNDGMIAVWALDTRHVDSNECRLYSVPRNSIGFLHAQEGLFTYLASGNLNFVVDGNWPQLEERLPSEALVKLTLPFRECAELRRLLWAEHVSRAHLMPTHDNITIALKSLWRQAGEQSVDKASG